MSIDPQYLEICCLIWKHWVFSVFLLSYSDLVKERIFAKLKFKTYLTDYLLYYLFWSMFHHLLGKNVNAAVFEFHICLLARVDWMWCRSILIFLLIFLFANPISYEEMCFRISTVVVYLSFSVLCFRTFWSYVIWCM